MTLADHSPQKRVTRRPVSGNTVHLTQQGGRAMDDQEFMIECMNDRFISRREFGAGGAELAT